MAGRTGRLRLGCLSVLAICVLGVLSVYTVIALWSFHIGGRFTPKTEWAGVGRLRDSSGSVYGVYASFFPDIRRGSYGYHSRQHGTALRGKASVCTVAGAKYQFGLRGETNAWLDTDGKTVMLDFREDGKPRLRRHFSLYGAWQGPNLVLDDHKSMFMYIQPGGSLTPTTSYTSPVPEKHANLTLSWGSKADFDAMCGALGERP